MAVFHELEFCSVLEELYRTRSAVGTSGRPSPYLGSLSTLNNILAIRKVLLRKRPRRTLEIGLACGASALTFASTLRELGQGPDKQHVAIDAFQREYDDVGRLKLKEAGLDGYVDILEGLSMQELARLVAGSQVFDVIYVDGSHRFEDVFTDFYFARFLLPVGGVLMFDDSADPNVAKVIKFIKANLARGFRQIPIYDVREVRGFAKFKLAVGEQLYRTQLAVFERVGSVERAGADRFRSF